MQPMSDCPPDVCEPLPQLFVGDAQTSAMQWRRADATRWVVRVFRARFARTLLCADTREATDLTSPPLRHAAFHHSIRWEAKVVSDDPTDMETFQFLVPRMGELIFMCDSSAAFADAFDAR